MINWIQQLNHWGENASAFAWPMLWQSSLLIVVVFALDYLLARRVRAAVRHALWMVVLVKLLLPPALALTARGAWAVILVKPQFEVGKAAIGKGGIVRDAQARERALAGMVDFIAATPDWRVLGTMESPMPGGDGNIEYLLAASKV